MNVWNFLPDAVDFSIFSRFRKSTESVVDFTDFLKRRPNYDLRFYQVNLRV